jgi:hypothetical protein
MSRIHQILSYPPRYASRVSRTAQTDLWGGLPAQRPRRLLWALSLNLEGAGVDWRKPMCAQEMRMFRLARHICAIVMGEEKG